MRLQTGRAAADVWPPREQMRLLFCFKLEGRDQGFLANSQPPHLLLCPPKPPASAPLKKRNQKKKTWQNLRV